MARTVIFVSTDLDLTVLRLRALRLEPRDDEAKSFDELACFCEVRQKFLDTVNMYAMWITAHRRGLGDPGQVDEEAYEPLGSRHRRQVQLLLRGRYDAERPADATESIMLDLRQTD